MINMYLSFNVSNENFHLIQAKLSFHNSRMKHHLVKKRKKEKNETPLTIGIDK